MTRKQVNNFVRHARDLMARSRYRVRARRERGRCVVDAQLLHQGHAHHTIRLASASNWDEAARQACGGRAVMAQAGAE